MQTVYTVCNAGGFNSGALKSQQEWTEAHKDWVVKPADALAAFRPALVLYTKHAFATAQQYERSAGVVAIPIQYSCTYSPRVVSSKPRRPTLFAISQILDPEFSVPRDQPWVVTGAWEPKQGAHDWDLHADPRKLMDLCFFVNTGERPITIGWGSAVPNGISRIAMLRLAIQALMSVGRRGVILGGWAKIHRLGEDLLDGRLQEIGDDHEQLREYASQNLFFASKAPYAWLLARSACVVHHGGAGATHAGIRTGCPAVVTPVADDDFYFSERVHRIGAGIGFGEPLHKIDALQLGDAIAHAQQLRIGVRYLSQSMASENGVDRAANSIVASLS